jgi:VanZ family protein
MTDFLRNFWHKFKAFSLTRKLVIFALLFYWPTLFIISHIPIPGVVYKARISDKMLHTAAYLILIFLLWYSGGIARKVNWKKPLAWLLILIIGVYALLDEVIQGMVGRNFDFMDMAADAIGGLLGLILFSVFSFWASFLVVTGAVVFILTNLAKANLSELMPRMDAVFHLTAYAVFTLLWMKNSCHFKFLKESKILFAASAFLVPAVFLAAAKIYARVMERSFSAQSVYLALGGIAFGMIIWWAFSLVLRRKGGG